MCLTLSNSYTNYGVHGVKTIVMKEAGSVVNDDQIELFEKKQETERKRTIEMLIVIKANEIKLGTLYDEL